LIKVIRTLEVDKMTDSSKRIVCPDCDQELLQRNIRKHYNRSHPGLDPFKRMRESSVRRERSSRGGSGPSPAFLMFIAVSVALFLVIAGLITYSMLNKVDGQPETKNIWFAASDGAVINGTFYPSGEPGSHTIYLFHGLGEDRNAWGDLPRYYQKHGYNVVALDLRGHGESTKSIRSADIIYDHRQMTEADFQDMVYDLIGAKDWVQKGDVDGIPNSDASEFGAVVILAYRPTIAPVLIYERFGAYGLRHAIPATALLLLACLLLFVLFKRLTGGRRHAAA